MAAALVRDGREILASVVHGQVEVHSPYGGVVPELASRDHVRAVSAVVEAALSEAGIGLEAVDGIAVTAGPGLIGSLLVGLSFAKALAYARGLPLVGVHHLVGHLIAAELASTDEPLTPPYLGLVVSGGHTALYRVPEVGAPVALGETRDDAAGEAFDKVAKLLGLGFPGGPAIASAAEAGDPKAILLPRPMRGREGLDFSYSGLKTAVSLAVERQGGLARLSQRAKADLAASFEAVVVESLVERTLRAAAQEDLARIAVVGGVAANARLRRELVAAAEREGRRAIFPPMSLCTDNAVMIAAAGTRLLLRGVRDDLALEAFSRVPIGETPWRVGGGVSPAASTRSGPTDTSGTSTTTGDRTSA
ncbi:MAG: tRNA (adenosine(37)-N6)-threonylcarbamoyltransferase complex transferase subunit TsaD [Deltaproteobacteria bacterium]|nr:tRNA (adenosine(37)-N6)-threonylcarbamoyltransferase complex transferase subunit TsaD [Deltaproteobacteria bacterium]